MRWLFLSKQEKEILLDALWEWIDEIQESEEEDSRVYRLWKKLTGKEWE